MPEYMSDRMFFWNLRLWTTIGQVWPLFLLSQDSRTVQLISHWRESRSDVVDAVICNANAYKRNFIHIVHFTKWFVLWFSQNIVTFACECNAYECTDWSLKAFPWSQSPPQLRNSISKGAPARSLCVIVLRRSQWSRCQETWRAGVVPS